MKGYLKRIVMFIIPLLIGYLILAGINETWHLKQIHRGAVMFTLFITSCIGFLIAYADYQEETGGF